MMKTYKLLICFVAWFMLCSITAFGQKEVVVTHSGQKIDIKSFAEQGKVVYGDSGHGGDQNNGFAKSVEKLNGKKKIEGLSFSIENGKAIMTVTDLTKIKNNSVLEFCYAINKGDGEKQDWWPDGNKTFSIAIKTASNESSLEDGEIGNTGFETGKLELQRLSQRVDAIETSLSLDTLKVNADSSIAGDEDASSSNLCTIIILLLIALGLAWLFFKVLQLEKAQIALKRELLKPKADKREELRNKQRPVSAQVYPPVDTMNSGQIKAFVVEQIKTALANQAQQEMPKAEGTHQQKVATNDVQKNDIDTQDVIYDLESKSLMIEKTAEPLFRIYSRNGDYFYTLVENEEIRNQLLQGITAFTDFISYTSAGGTATKVVPVKDGRLFQEGSRFTIDQNNKLQVNIL